MNSPTSKLRVGVLFGGGSGEHEVSLMSERSVLRALDKDKYDVTQIGITHEGVWLVGEDLLDRMIAGNLSGLKRVALLPDPTRQWLYSFRSDDKQEVLESLSSPDVIFPVLHGTFGEDGTLQGFFEMGEFAYVGSGVLGSSLGMDKAVATRVRLNGRSVNGVQPGAYLVLERPWKRGDTIDIEFDFSLHFWAAEKECAGRVSIYRGPLLLTYDRRFNVIDPDKIPGLHAAGLNGQLVDGPELFPPLVLLEVQAGGGQGLRLCDFGSAGVGGSPYRSWLEVSGAGGAAFSRTYPLRSHRPGQ